MEDTAFWKIIEAANREADGDCEAVVELIHRQLETLPPAEIQAFDALIGAKLRWSYSRPLWGAAYLINGGCSDDGFEYFRGWLVSRGQAVFDAAVADPDSLVDVVDPENDNHECEALLYLARQTFEEVTGQSMPPGSGNYPREPSGGNWDFDDDTEMARRLPRLWQLYGGECGRSAVEETKDRISRFEGTRIRVFAVAQTPASERTRRPGSQSSGP
jgi:hypothetical protein